MAVLTVLEGDEPVELLGLSTNFALPSKLKKKIKLKPGGKRKRSLFRKIGHAAASAGRATGHVAASAGRGTGHVVATAARATGHAVAQASRVSTRVIKRIVRGAARKILLHGDGFLGQDSLTTMSKGQAITAITTAGTGAVAAAFTPAVAAGAAPIIFSAAKEAVDEIYATVKKKITGGTSPAQAAAEAEQTFKDEPPGFQKYLVPAGIAVLGFLLLSGQRSPTR